MATTTAIQVHLDEESVLHAHRGQVRHLPPYVVLNFGADVTVFARAEQLDKLEAMLVEARLELDKTV